jgi:hypothetical protein
MKKLVLTAIVASLSFRRGEPARAGVRLLFG